MFRQHFYELRLLPGVAGSHLVTGMTEYEEGNQDESREQRGHYRKALLVGHIVADLADFGGQSPLGVVPHLII